MGESPPNLSSTPSATTESSLAKSHPIIKTNQLHGHEVRNTVFISCNLRDMNLQGCTVSMSTLDNCKLSKCAVTNCNLVSTALHESKFASSSVERCKITTSPLALRKFPPELRILIFERCIDFEDRITPSILSALRGDPELYSEAIDCFYRLNVIRITEKGLSDCDRMSAVTMRSVRRLHISFDRSPGPIVCNLPTTMLNASRLSHVWLSVYNPLDLIPWAKYLIESFLNVHFLCVGIPVRYVRGTHDRSIRLRSDIDLLNLHIGFVALMWRVTSSYWEPWTWKVPKGQYLTWKDL
ncbi:hypothetical protein VTL71DRAFT_8629 [Oculimacula yallundae]|uniref:F-box domain-containing protein n=1 Tax=Oculimacula yallundae TaxID=86028 RepID=A0ABR4CY88_9HELO